MRSLILAAAIVLFFGSLANAQCRNGVCTYSVRADTTAVSSDVGIVARIATAPRAAVATGRVSVRATGRVFTNQPVRRVLRRVFNR